MFCCICFSSKAVDDPRSPLTNSNINSSNYDKNVRDSNYSIRSTNAKVSEVEVVKLSVLVPISSPSILSDAHSDR